MQLLLSFVTWLALAGSPLRAPSPEEEHLFAEGLRAYEAGDPRAAEHAWRMGYQIAHDPAFLVRIGEAQEKAGAPAEAIETYRRYLRDAPDASDRTDIEQRLARLAPMVVPLPGAPPAANEPAEIPGELGGSHPQPAVPLAPPRTAPAATQRATDQEAPAQDVEGWNTLRGTAWICTGVAAAAFGAAGFFAANAASKKDDVNRLVIFRDEKTGAPLEYGPVAAQYQSAVKDGERYDRNAKIALGIGISTAVFATILFVIDSVREPERHLALGIAPSPRGDGGAASLSWTF